MARDNSGVWAVVNTAETPARVIEVNSSEIKALRAAVSRGYEVVGWRYGESIDAAIERQVSGVQPAEPATKPSARRPAPMPDGEGGVVA